MRIFIETRTNDTKDYRTGFLVVGGIILFLPAAIIVSWLDVYLPAFLILLFWYLAIGINAIFTKRFPNLINFPRPTIVRGTFGQILGIIVTLFSLHILFVVLKGVLEKYFSITLHL